MNDKIIYSILAVILCIWVFFLVYIVYQEVVEYRKKLGKKNEISKYRFWWKLYHHSYSCVWWVMYWGCYLAGGFREISEKAKIGMEMGMWWIPWVTVGIVIGMYVGLMLGDKWLDKWSLRKDVEWRMKRRESMKDVGRKGAVENSVEKSSEIELR